jgi:hypothetical protein
MEHVETINQRLVEHYGFFEGTNANWRVVFSDDQFETRIDEFEDRTPEGFLIRRVRGARMVPKYQHCPHRYVLERALPVPMDVHTELVTKWSYEPVWVFQTSTGQALPPKWEVCKIIVDQIYAEVYRRHTGAKYEDPELQPDAKEVRVKQMEEMLFGNESNVTDALAHKQAVIVPETKQ